MNQHAEKTGTFQTEDGLSLFYRQILPGKKPVKDRILINHGIGESSETYEYLIDALSKASYEIWIYEMRGHGKSPGVRGHAGSIDELVRDLNSFINHINPGNRKIFLLGHSLGGLVVLNYIMNYGDNKIKALIVNGAGLLVEETPVLKVKKIIGILLRSIAPSLTMDTGIKNDTLSSFTEYLEKRAKNMLLHTKVSASLGIALINEGKQILSGAKKITLPIFITHGGDDKIVNPEGSALLFEKVSSTDKKLHIYSGLKHEIYNENKKEVFSELIEWMNKHIDE